MPCLLWVLLYREIPYCSRHKKREASGSVRQTLLHSLLPSALHILCHLHLLRRLPIPPCDLRLFVAQLCQDGHPAIFAFEGHIIASSVNHVVVLFFIYLGTAEILPILIYFCQFSRGGLSIALPDCVWIFPSGISCFCGPAVSCGGLR